jgi:hypothetical protein
MSGEEIVLCNNQLSGSLEALSSSTSEYGFIRDFHIHSNY